MFSFMLRVLDATWSTPQAPKAITAIRATGTHKAGNPQRNKSHSADREISDTVLADNRQHLVGLHAEDLTGGELRLKALADSGAREVG